MVTMPIVPDDGSVQVYAPGWTDRVPWLCLACGRVIAHEYAWRLAFGGIVCDYCAADARKGR